MTSDAPAPKVKLSMLLEKVTAIASGADKDGKLSDAEDYDAASAPDGAMRWCASVLRVFLLRVIEHVKDTRGAINMLFTVLKDPALKEGDAWRSDIPTMRAQLAEIVAAIRAGAPTEETEKPAEETTEAKAAQAQLDDVAAALARGEKPDVTVQALGRITPIKKPVGGDA